MLHRRGRPVKEWGASVSHGGWKRWSRDAVQRPDLRCARGRPWLLASRRSSASHALICSRWTAKASPISGGTPGRGAHPHHRVTPARRGRAGGHDPERLGRVLHTCFQTATAVGVSALQALAQTGGPCTWVGRANPALGIVGGHQLDRAEGHCRRSRSMFAGGPGLSQAAATALLGHAHRHKSAR